MLDIRLLLNRKAIETQANAHSQNFLSGKDIMQKTPGLSLKVFMNYI